MKYYLFILLLSAYFLLPTKMIAQSNTGLQAKVNDLVLKHYPEGIPYNEAHKLGHAALPYLVDLLKDPDKKAYWVNVIVTIGFIEDPSAVDPLISFLEETEGEVDSHTFRALLSVPYALGCIASEGNKRALQYLIDSIEKEPNIGWSFREKAVAKLMAEYSLLGLAVSGRPEARNILLDLKKEKRMTDALEPYGGNLEQALAIMERIREEGRAAVFNPN